MQKIKEKLKNFFNLNTSDAIKNNKIQNAITFFIIFFVMIIFVFILYFRGNHKKDKIKIKNRYKEKIDIINSINPNPEAEWIAKSEKEIEKLSIEDSKMSEQIAVLKQELEDFKNTNGEAMEYIAGLIGNIQTQQENLNNNEEAPHDLSFKQIKPELAIYKANLKQKNLNFESNYKNGFDLENYLPAVSYAPAIILMGADASVAIKNQKNPNHIIFKIIGPAVAAEFKGKKQTIDKVKGCRVHGSVIGDISSEKAYVRLLKMQCSFEEGRSVEFDVEGFAASMGKSGIRGPVISREARFLWYNFFSKFLEGAANITSLAVAPNVDFAGGVAVQNYTMSDALKSGVSKGVANVGSETSEYIEDRLEQLQPVIAIQAGIKVDLIFINGIDLTGGNRSNKESNFIKTTKEIANQEQLLNYHNNDFNNINNINNINTNYLNNMGTNNTETFFNNNQNVFNNNGVF